MNQNQNMNSYSDAAATVTKHGVEKNTKYDESIKTTISVATADINKPVADVKYTESD